jgi:ubiquinone biosynthesis monooxygenase Coq7
MNLIVKIIQQVDTALRTILPPKQRLSQRPNPGDFHQSVPMVREDINLVAGFMRVNHAGEVCAQALYQGQALTAKLDKVKSQMMAAAAEEVDHLAWCEQRLRELNSHPSILNPFWYASSFMIGACAGFAGDSISLGFVAETERQVAAHLQKHVDKIPKEDLKTYAILTQMQQDEAQHASFAQQAGAIEFPWYIKQLMQRLASVLTHSSYYI